MTTAGRSVASVLADAQRRCGVIPTDTNSSSQTPSCSGVGPAGGKSSSAWIGSNDLLERLSRLALTDRTQIPGLPPVTTVVERSEPMGTRFVATEEYRTWFTSQYGLARDEVAPPQAGVVQPDPSNGTRRLAVTQRSLDQFRKAP